jgi:hypothetical protein
MIDPLRRYGKNSWIGKPAFITGTSPGAIGSALAQQHLRAVNDRNRHDRARRQDKTNKGTSPTRARGNFSEASSVVSLRLSYGCRSPRLRGHNGITSFAPLLRADATEAFICSNARAPPVNLGRSVVVPAHLTTTAI